MDYRPSDRLSAHSFPHPRWSQLNTSNNHNLSAASSNTPCRHEHALDETSRAYRITALRQLNGNPRPLSWKARQPTASTSTTANNSSGGRSSSALVSQPVLVRSYSGDPDETPRSSFKMPSRRPFPFIGGGTSSSSSSSSNNNNNQKNNKNNRSSSSGPELPAEDEFSIDNILRAIEPNIRTTLDSIGEICGRSKLSLANEYGSHIAPLGEIRAPPGGLLTVEEASSDLERYSGDNVVIYDDENSATDGRDNSTPFSHYTFFDTLLPSLGPPSHAGIPPGQQPQMDHPSRFSDSAVASLPTTREFASKPRSGGRALLGTPAESSDEMLTPALVSEILLDAQANGGGHCFDGSHSSESQPSGQEPSVSPRRAVDMPGGWAAEKTSELQSLFRWLRIAGWNDHSDLEPQQTAEMRLRAMLERTAEVSPT